MFRKKPPLPPDRNLETLAALLHLLQWEPHVFDWYALRDRVPELVERLGEDAADLSLKLPAATAVAVNYAKHLEHRIQTLRARMELADKGDDLSNAESSWLQNERAGIVVVACVMSELFGYGSEKWVPDLPSEGEIARLLERKP